MEFIFFKHNFLKKIEPIFNIESFFINPNEIKKFIINDADFNLLIAYKSNERINDFLYSDSEFVVIYNGNTSNKEKVFNRANQNSSLTSPEFILDAYKLHGKNFIKKIQGEFSIIIFDKKKKETIFFIDRFGINGLYYYLNESLIISSKLSYITNQKNINLSINKKRLADYIEMRISDGEYTFYNEIKKLKPSYMATQLNNEVYKKKYYSFKSIKPNNKLNKKNAANLLKKSLANAIRLDTNKDERNAVMFSGGLDSSSVLGVISSQSGKGITAISAVYKNLPKKFLHLINEEQYQNKMIEKYPNIKHVKFDASSISTIDDIDFYTDLIGEPFFFPNLYLANTTYKIAKDLNIDSVLNGNDGDTIISHGYENLISYLFRMKWVTLLDEINSLSKNYKISRKSIIKRLIFDRYFIAFLEYIKVSIFKRKKLDLITKEFAKKTDFFNRNIFKPKLTKPYHNHILSIESYLHQDAIYKQSSVASYYGINEKYPFYNINLIESSLKIPPKFKFHKGYSRFILRLAMKNILPDNILKRSGKANLGFALCFNLLKNKNLIERELECPNEYLIDKMDIKKISNHWKEFKKSPYTYSVRSKIPSQIFLYVTVNRWLRRNKFHKEIDNS